MKNRHIVVLSIFALLLLIFLTSYTLHQQARFGQLSADERLERIKQSPNYHQGRLVNLEKTPDLTEGYSGLDILLEQLFNQVPTHPVDLIPSIKTQITSLPPEQDLLIWFGHSSYFMQIDGKKILVDPVFSESASPFSFIAKAFPSSHTYSVADLPQIDYLLITHDHWDHLDYQTVLQLKSKVSNIICGLGVGAHFAYWGFDKHRIIEGDWYDRINLDKKLFVQLVPARHSSGRGVQRNQALWTAFALQSRALKIFIGGDSGYGSHFAKIKDTFGSFYLAILENGQYNQHWKYIHMTPAETWQAAQDLGAKRLFPVHSGKFVLAMHHWREPLEQISRLSQDKPIALATPMIGEPMYLNNPTQTFSTWWQTIR